MTSATANSEHTDDALLDAMKAHAASAMRPPADERIDKTALSWWFPRIEAAGLPVPRTTIIKMPREAQESIWAAFDGKDGGNAFPFFVEIASAGDVLGWPCFLRTDHTSGKHSWRETCFLSSAGDLARHVYAIAEFSEMAGFPGLPWDGWAVREMLPTIPLGICLAFGDMPICREFRFFVEDGKVECWHPYWPLEALKQGAAVSYDRSAVEGLFAALCSPGQTKDVVELNTLAARAGAALGGAWSVDILETARGWVVTDMAEAHKSYHWPGCPRAK